MSVPPLFNSSLVEYQCSCSAWQPLCQLHFCRKCNVLRCGLCLSEQIDNTFCPHCCMEDNRSAAVEAGSQRRFRCTVCNECPRCGNFVKFVEPELCYLRCAICGWSSRAEGIPDRAADSAEPWPPEVVNPMDANQNRISAYLKDLNNQEKLEKETMKLTKKRLSNISVLRNDRYGLNAAYMARRKMLQSNRRQSQNQHNLEDIAASESVPELDASIFTEPVDSNQILTLEQTLAHPIVSISDGIEHLSSNKIQLISRKVLRCSCETILYRSEYSINVVKPRLQNFAKDIYPELRISRKAMIAPGQQSSIFFTIANNSLNIVDLKIKGNALEDDPKCIDTSNFTLTLKLEPKEDDIDSKDRRIAQRADDYNMLSREVVFISRNKAGFCVDCLPSDIKFTSISSDAYYALMDMEISAKDNPVKTCRIKIRLCADEKLE